MLGECNSVLFTVFKQLCSVLLQGLPLINLFAFNLAAWQAIQHWHTVSGEEKLSFALWHVCTKNWLHIFPLFLVQLPVCSCVLPGRGKPFFTHTAGHGPLIPGHQYLPQSNVSASPSYFREAEQAGRGEGKTEVAHLHNSIICSGT